MELNLSKRQITGIDFLRGWFSIMVIIAHAISPLGLPKSNPFYIIFSSGSFWVIGFFVLSGYCISLSVFREIERGSYNVKRYLCARATRIYPLFYIGLLFAVVLWFMYDRGQEFPVIEFLFSAFGMQTFFQTFPYYSPSWSITYELVYYLVFPLLIFLARGKLQNTLVYGLGISLVLTIVFGVLWKLLNEHEYMSVYWSLPLHFTSWLAGLFLVLNADKFKTYLSKNKILFLTGVIFLLSFLVQFYGSYTKQSVLFFKFNLPLVSISYMLFTYNVRFFKIFDNKAFAKVCHYLGMLSYPLYLFHDGIQEIIMKCLPNLPTIPLLILLLVIPILICATLGVQLEKFFLARRSRVLKKMS